MRAIRTSGLMSGDGKRSVATQGPSYRARPRLYVRPDGAVYQWRKDPPSELSVALVADERPGGATRRAEAS